MNSASTQSPVRVLLVDDDEEDFIITRDLFSEIEDGRYQLEWIGEYSAALAAIRDQRFDVCLVDYHLGGKSGLELITEARGYGNRSPIILLTGLGDHEVDLRAMRAGAADFLVKGQLNAESLDRSIRYAVERKRAEDRIQKLAAFAHQNPYPVFELGVGGALTYCNAAALSMAGTMAKGAPAALLPKETPSIVAECLATGQNRLQFQTHVASRTLSWAFFPIPATKTVHCYATDITERLSLEAQLRQAQKMEAIGQLAAGVAHDFNNLLTVIQGHTSLLQTVLAEDANAGRSLAKIAFASDRASKLVRQLLTLSRKQVLQPQLLDLNETISNVSRMLHRVLGEDIALLAPVTPGLPAVHADGGMIEQILMNLAVNARDAMPRGGKLTIRTHPVTLSPDSALGHPQARPGQFVCLMVSDTGCGIDPSITSRIFDPFFTTKEPGKGTGLGLTTVYSIVQQHHGWIELESELGRGTTFRIHLPAIKAKAHAAPLASMTTPASGGTETVLVVEDEAAVRDLATEVLKLQGYHVLAAESGLHALELWKRDREQIDLLLTDMVMPGGINGPELAEKLTRDKPELKLIFTSGYSPGIAGKDVTLMAGLNFLPKPYQPARLAALVRECLDRCAAGRSGPEPTAALAGA